MATVNSNSSYRHGHCAKSGKSKTYRVWRSMMQRCYRRGDKAYKYYGAREISVCKRWHDFVNFLEDMGESPSGLTLERKNNNSNYEKSNCEWVTRSRQARNKRTTQMITYDGETLSASDWAERIGVKVKTLKKRIGDGWEIGIALTTPTLSIQEVSRRGTLAQYGHLETKQS